MKAHSRVGILLWLSAVLAVLSHASAWFFPRKTFGLFVWGFEAIPLMEWLFFLLPIGPTVVPLLLLLIPAVRRGGQVPKHAIYPLGILFASYLLYLGAWFQVLFLEEWD